MSVSESRKIELRTFLEEFAKNPSATEYEFPANLTNHERAFIHKQAQVLGLRSKSRGGGDNRYLTIFKQRKVNTVGACGDSCIPEVYCGDNALNVIGQFIGSYPVTEAELMALMYQGIYQERSRVIYTPTMSQNRPAVPPWPNMTNVPPNVAQVKMNLPVQNSRAVFFERLERSQVLLIIGETGSGKSTQIPQFILEDASATGSPCRIVVAEPRRIAAISLAERVAAERGEDVGYMVGYQIRLDSRLSPHALVTFCTNGVLLKEIIGGPNFFETVTHIIIDEIHERDKFTDFLLIILRDVLPNYPHLKLILMSASLEKELLENYFHTCRFLEVPGRAFPIQSYFLTDILFMMNYVPTILAKLRPNRPNDLAAASLTDTPAIVTMSHSRLCQHAHNHDTLDTQLEIIWKSGNVTRNRMFSTILEQIVSGVLDVNYQHSCSQASLLMIAAGVGFDDIVERLLAIGADPQKVSANGWQALHWAMAFGNSRCVMRLNSVTAYQNVVDIYHGLVDDDQIDIGLIVELLVFINDQMSPGAVLVFLPGYDDILQTKEAIRQERRLPHSKVFLCMLHSQMRGHEQRKAFDPVPAGKRRIVLSTNVAEVSITLEDVSYVIDTGKMKQRGYDAINDVSAISTMWISKMNVVQRAGRAGRCRPGTCFHLYSDLRYSAMPEKGTPEILRVPIHELCLQTKLIKPDLPSVAQFLRKAPEPPSDVLVNSSIQLLKRLTILGRSLIELPVDPQVGKMILYGAVLRCLDPVITVAACLSYGEPFLLPRERSLAEIASQRRYQLGRTTPFSDHGVLLNAFYGWNSERPTRQEHRFADHNLLSKSAMEMIDGIRGLLKRSVMSLGFGAGLSEAEFENVFNRYGNDWPVVKAALTAGTYPNIAIIDRTNGKLMTKTESALLNPSSVLLFAGDGQRATKETRAQVFDSLPTEWVIYNEMCRQNYNMQVKCATIVDSLTIALFAGPCNLSLENARIGRLVNTDNECWDSEDGGVEVKEITILNIDDWIKVRMENSMAGKLIGIRQKFHALFLRQLMNPAGGITQMDEGTLSSVVGLLKGDP